MLYTKYRPRQFGDVIGQPAAKGLRNASKFGCFPHAILLYGPRGCGKTTLARICAIAANCSNLRRGEPCGKCESCKNPDYIESDSGAYGSKDSILGLRRVLNTKPRYKKVVAILDEAHGLSKSAQMSFLKILEEPPEDTLLILLTTDLEALSVALQSRCSRWPIGLVPQVGVVQLLGMVSKRENLKMTKGAAKLISTVSGGSVRDALSILETFVVYRRPITEKFVREVTAFADVFPLIDALEDGDISEVIATARKLYEHYLAKTIMLQVARDLSNFVEKKAIAGEQVERLAKMALLFNAKARARVIDEETLLLTTVIQAHVTCGNPSNPIGSKWEEFVIAVTGGVGIFYDEKLLSQVTLLMNVSVSKDLVTYEHVLDEEVSQEIKEAFEDYANKKFDWRKKHDTSKTRGTQGGRKSTKRRRKRKVFPGGP